MTCKLLSADHSGGRVPASPMFGRFTSDTRPVASHLMPSQAVHMSVSADQLLRAANAGPASSTAVAASTAVQQQPTTHTYQTKELCRFCQDEAGQVAGDRLTPLLPLLHCCAAVTNFSCCSVYFSSAAGWFLPGQCACANNDSIRALPPRQLLRNTVHKRPLFFLRHTNAHSTVLQCSHSYEAHRGAQTVFAILLLLDHTYIAFAVRP